MTCYVSSGMLTTAYLLTQSPILCSDFNLTVHVCLMHAVFVFCCILCAVYAEFLRKSCLVCVQSCVTVCCVMAVEYVCSSFFLHMDTSTILKTFTRL